MKLLILLAERAYQKRLEVERLLSLHTRIQVMLGRFGGLLK